MDLRLTAEVAVSAEPVTAEWRHYHKSLSMIVQVADEIDHQLVFAARGRIAVPPPEPAHSLRAAAVYLAAVRGFARQ